LYHRPELTRGSDASYVSEVIESYLSLAGRVVVGPLSWRLAQSCRFDSRYKLV